MNIDSLPTVPDETCWYRVEQHITRCQEKMETMWRFHYRIILSVVCLFSLVTIITLVVATQKTATFPCLFYDATTLASAVSVECIQYTWNMNCATRNPYTFPADYMGWWRSSPQGLTAVPCITPTTICGIGSYRNMLLQMQFCSL